MSKVIIIHGHTLELDMGAFLSKSWDKKTAGR